MTPIKIMSGFWVFLDLGSKIKIPSNQDRR